MNVAWHESSIETFGRVGLLGVLSAVMLVPGYPLWLGLGALSSGRIETVLSPVMPLVVALVPATVIAVPVVWLADRWFGRLMAVATGVVLTSVYAAVFYLVVPDVFAI